VSSIVVKPADKPLIGYAEVPGDKSISHRSLMFGALADGVVRVTGLGDGADNGRTASAMRALGVDIRGDGDALIVHGVGVDGLRAPSEAIYCGNSGTTIRLLCGLLAGQGFDVTLTGDESLNERPMRRVIDPLSSMGASIGGAAGSKPDESYPPLSITAAKLRPVRYELPVASAQVKSAVLLAGLYADGETIAVEPGASRDHTERMLGHMGAPIEVRPGGVVSLNTAGWDRKLSVDAFDVPADPSSAAFILAAALVAGAERVTVANVCTNPTRTGFLDALGDMGARVERQAMRAAGEPIADLVVTRGAGDALGGAVISGDLTVRSIDEIPVLAVVASRADGVTDFRDAAELRVKESDRIASTVAMLRAFGVETEERDDGFSVQGTSEPLKAARIDSHGDHRIAMAAAVAALVADGEVRIDDTDNVSTSFPRFVEVMRELGADISAA
jgi:3-phosphoshikimate 1-carboxyvinyltransferase